MNSSKPVLILGKGITGESFENTFRRIINPLLLMILELKKKDFNLNENKDFNFVCADEIDFKNIKFIACSPGFDLDHEIIRNAKQQNIEIKSDIGIFIDANPSKKILVSGTNGKSTVCSWLEKLFNFKKSRYFSNRKYWKTSIGLRP